MMGQAPKTPERCNCTQVSPTPIAFLQVEKGLRSRAGVLALCDA